MSHAPITDPVFGELTWEADYHWWRAQVALTPKHDIEVTIDWDEEQPLDELLAVCRTAFVRIRKNERRYRLDTAENLLELYNDTWRDSAAPVETRESFARKLELGSVSLRDDGSAELWYDSETDFFAGHSIQALINDDGSFDDADIPG